MIHIERALACAAVLLGMALVGCDQPPETWESSDPGGDTGSDSATETGPAECPWNSGYPCTCDRVGGECDDQSECLYVTGDGAVGICSATCYEPYTDCVKTGFGGESSCVLAGGGASFRCALICEEDGQCPPDQGCVETDWDETLCHP